MDMNLCAIICVATLPVLCMAHEEHSCYGGGDVAGIIIASIVVTLVFVGLALAAAWYRRKKILDYFGEGCLRDGPETEVRSKKKTRKGADTKFAFDNPYFREDDQKQHQGSSTDAIEKGHGNGTSNAAFDGNQQNGKIGDGATANGKGRKAKMGNPFSSVFSLQSKKQPRTMDDSCLAVEPERLVVPLRGHDFTGLGFNICGNMRDGIFVKDVLHRGPANESGKIKAGDRILAVTVSFSKMVYEDALTILSYASPYDVQLELEKVSEPINSRLHSGPPASVFLAGLQNKRLGSSSFTTGTRLFHPLYRSQSIDDLTQIGKDGLSSPKRSQSIGLSVLQRSRSGQKNASASDDSRPTSTVLTTGSLNERMLANAIGEDGLCKRALESLRETKGEDSSPGKTAHDVPKAKPPVLWSVTKEISLKEPEESSPEDPSGTDSLPKKMGKRKAPPPPPESGNSLETEAQVHRANESFSPVDASSDSDEKDFDGDRDSLDGRTSKVNGREDSDTSDDSLDEGEDSFRRSKRREKKRKSSSLGDLTNIEEAINKHSALVLERAVSLDLQQQAPIPPGIQTLIPSEGVECLTAEMNNAKPFQQLTLVTSTPVPDRERSTLISNIGHQASRIPRREISYPSSASDYSLSSEPGAAKPGLKNLPLEHSFRPPMRSDDSLRSRLRSDDSLRSPSSFDDSLRSPFRSDSDSESFPRNGVTPYSSSQSDREVIKITESELDDVMMSHKQFLLKQAKATGVYSGLNPTKTAPGLSFESWSYEDNTSTESSPTRNPINGSSSFESSYYSTQLDTPQTRKTSKPPEISHVILRSPNDGKTGTFTSMGAVPKKVFSASDSPPPRLEQAK